MLPESACGFPKLVCLGRAFPQSVEVGPVITLNCDGVLQQTEAVESVRHPGMIFLRGSDGNEAGSKGIIPRRLI